jgi:citrate synthase
MTAVQAGLKGVIAAETHLSSVDGLAGELIIGGFALEELAGEASFEEVVYLLWHGDLPDETQLVSFRTALAERRVLPEACLMLLKEAANQQASVIDALKMAVGTLSLEGQGDSEDEAMTVVASFPSIVAAYWRLVNGQDPVAPRSDLGHAANYLYMLTGQVADEASVRALETYLNTVVDHGLNASTFTARVIISTRSDLISAVVGAIGALKGPLHGGAPGPALDMVFEIGKVENAEPYLRAKLEVGERLMGFGHAIYKVRDPRAEMLSKAAEQFFQMGGDRALYELVREVETIAVRLLEEYKPGRNLQTNVEFYTALLLHGLGLPTDLFTPTFGIGRVAGWTAHCFEQQALDQIIRPGSVYCGEKDRAWVPVEERLVLA